MTHNRAYKYVLNVYITNNNKNIYKHIIFGMSIMYTLKDILYKMYECFYEIEIM